MPELLQPVPAINPVAPVPSILTTARRMSDSIIWKSGITWRPRNKVSMVGGEAAVESITICDNSGTVDLATLTNEDNAEALPWLARLPFFCEDVLPGYMDEYRADATKAMDAATAFFVSAVLYESDALDNADTVAAPTGPVHPLTAMSALLANYHACTSFGGAVIHVPPLLVPWLISSGAVKQVGDVYQGPMGSLVDPGPYGIWGEGDPGVVQGAMYVTGPVEYDVGPIEIPLSNQAARWDRRENGFYIEAQRLVIARTDPTCVFVCNAFLPSPAQGEGGG